MPVSRTATLLGLLAMLFWSSTVGLSRALIESVGVCTYVAVTSGCGGLLLLAGEAGRRRDWRAPFRLPAPYALLGGGCFVLYIACFATAMRLAPSRAVSVQLGLVNYLWPALLLLFSVPILGNKARWGLLLPGVGLGLAGIAAATVRGTDILSFPESIAANAPAFSLMLVAAVAWGLYSNLARRLQRPGAPSGTPLFQLASGLLFLAARFPAGETSHWTPAVIAPLAYVAIFPTALGYLLWENGMKHGDHRFLGAASYFIPLVSTLFSCWYLGVPPGWNLLAGCALVIAGALLSARGLKAGGAGDPRGR